METFLGGKVLLHRGNCLDVLPTLPENSVDSCVTDPPYHLTSIVKRFGREAESHLSVSENKNCDLINAPQYKRLSRGFMGKQWDGGSIAQSPELWAEVYRVLKPGAHLLAFGGTRTFHRMACAIEDAGFEVRDCIMWVYSQGFPKSHSLNRNPMCECNHGEPSSEYDVHAMRQADLSAAERDGEQQPDILFARLSEQSLSEYGTARAEPESSGTEQSGMGGRIVHRTRQGLPNDFEAGSSESASEWLRARAHSCSREDVRPTIGNGRGSASYQSRQGGQSLGEPTDLFQSSRPLDDGTLSGRGACPRCGKLKKEFDGFGTSLKPACEPIILARKPLSEATVAANVLRWGTGAINIDKCRVPAADVIGQRPRWPANLIHDGSDEVVRAFPSPHGAGHARDPELRAISQNIPFKNSKNGTNYARIGDSGSAARFFYSAKADGDDRLGSKHPTIKPVDLMQYLVRLITPPRGLVLDPFAGTGSTGEAAWREGMSAILIEREDEYCADICRRMQLALAGPDERLWQSIKARGQVESPGPLFEAIE